MRSFPSLFFSSPNLSLSLSLRGYRCALLPFFGRFISEISGIGSFLSSMAFPRNFSSCNYSVLVVFFPLNLLFSSGVFCNEKETASALKFFYFYGECFSSSFHLMASVLLQREGNGICVKILLFLL